MLCQTFPLFYSTELSAKCFNVCKRGGFDVIYRTIYWVQLLMTKKSDIQWHIYIISPSKAETIQTNGKKQCQETLLLGTSDFCQTSCEPVKHQLWLSGNVEGGCLVIACHPRTLILFKATSKRSQSHLTAILVCSGHCSRVFPTGNSGSHVFTQNNGLYWFLFSKIYNWAVF